MLFFFYNQISLSFSFSHMCLMGTFKKMNIVEFVKFSQQKFFNRQNFTFHSFSSSFSSKGEGNLVTLMVVSLTAWIGGITIN